MYGLRSRDRRSQATVPALLAHRSPVFSVCFRHLNDYLLVQRIAALECARHTSIHEVRRVGRLAISELSNRIAGETPWWEMAFSRIAAGWPARVSPEGSLPEFFS
jgi:hypothetical protein